MYIIIYLWFFRFRVYANRSLSMDRIKYVGFDMDYTLVGASGSSQRNTCTALYATDT